MTLVVNAVLPDGQVRRFLTIVWVLLAYTSLAACQQHPTRLSGQTMGTSYAITFAQLLPDARTTKLKALIKQSLEQVNASMSTYINDSEISLFNRSRSTQWQQASEPLVEVLRKAQHVSRLTGGAFDVTVGPLINLWGFGVQTAPDRLPTEEEIAQCLKHVGYQHLVVHPDNNMIKKNIADLTIDVSAIAKGYAVDRIARLLDIEGMEHYLIEVGGELRARGLNAAGKVWRVGIEHPDILKPALGVVQLDRAAIATSGDYHNYREFDGRKYSHLIDPTVGRPVTHRVAAVTVIAGSVMAADAWATALLVLGDRRGLALAQDRNIAAYFVLREDNTYTAESSDAFAIYM